MHHSRWTSGHLERPDPGFTAAGLQLGVGGEIPPRRLLAPLGKVKNPVIRRKPKGNSIKSENRNLAVSR